MNNYIVIILFLSFFFSAFFHFNSFHLTFPKKEISKKIYFISVSCLLFHTLVVLNTLFNLPINETIYYNLPSGIIIIISYSLFFPLNVINSSKKYQILLPIFFLICMKPLIPIVQSILFCLLSLSFLFSQFLKKALQNRHIFQILFPMYAIFSINMLICELSLISEEVSLSILASTFLFFQIRFDFLNRHHFMPINFHIVYEWPIRTISNLFLFFLVFISSYFINKNISLRNEDPKDFILFCILCGLLFLLISRIISSWTNRIVNFRDQISQNLNDYIYINKDRIKQFLQIDQLFLKLNDEISKILSSQRFTLILYQPQGSLKILHKENPYGTKWSLSNKLRTKLIDSFKKKYFLRKTDPLNHIPEDLWDSFPIPVSKYFTLININYKSPYIFLVGIDSKKPISKKILHFFHSDFWDIAFSLEKSLLFEQKKSFIRQKAMRATNNIDIESARNQTEELERNYQQNQINQKEIVNQEKFAALTRFSMSLDDEISNPLNNLMVSIQYYSDKLKTENNLSEDEKRKVLNIIISQSLRIKNILEDNRKALSKV